MASQPSNSFRTLSGVPVLYDRLKPSHYGKVGVERNFYCTPETEETLDRMFGDLFQRTAPFFGAAVRILTAGAWVDKSGQHGLGQAFDIDAIHWERIRFIADQQPNEKHLYLSVQAMCQKYFGTVLGYNYDADHEDHLHIDIGRPVKFRRTKSTTYFVQEAINALFEKNVRVDGDYGPETGEAFREVLSEHGIGWVDDLDDWRRFLDLACDTAVLIAADSFQADMDLVASLHSPHLVSLGAPGTATMAEALGGAAFSGAIAAAPPDSDDDDRLETEEDPTQVADDLDVDTFVTLRARPDTGRLDVNYAPHRGWRISSQTSGGRKKWYLEYDGQSPIYLGYEFKFGQTYGLARTARSGSLSLRYDYEDYKPTYGLWAPFIYPTSRCESEADFLVINAWDVAAFTLGFFQLAAHTGKHLEVLFKDLLTAIPGEANHYFPELKLGHQIGRTGSEANILFSVNGGSVLNLENPHRPTDGLPAKDWYRGHFMGFFNPHRGRLDAEEVHAAARCIAWWMNSEEARDVCVRNAVDTAKATVDSVHNQLRRSRHLANGLDGLPMELVAAAMDVRHQGRRNRDRHQSVIESIAEALKSRNPLDTFAKIDTRWRQKRSKRSVDEIRNLSSEFSNRVYDAGTQTFR